MFRIFRIRSIWRRFWRVLDILGVLLSYFWANSMGNNRFTRFLVPSKFKKDGAVRSKEERLCIVIQQLGPTFIKFGQILADRPDMISEKFRLQLKKLQSDVDPMDDDLAMSLIEQELGEPITNKFKFIDPKCIGSASIGQVYRGQLLTGEDVVIKIQRPNIKDKIKLDLQILEFMVKRVAEEYPELVIMNIPAFVKEFGESLMHELNYLHEVSNAMRFQAMFHDVEHCKIPKFYPAISSGKLVVMEYIQGIKPDSREELIAAGLDPAIVAKNGLDIFLKMIFEHGFFHADPHAGNMFIMPGNRIGLIDFGMTGSMKPSHMEFLASFTIGLATKSASKLTDALLKVSGTEFFKEKEDLEFRLQEILDLYSSMTYDTIDFSAVLQDCVKVIIRFELQIPSSIYMLIKALGTIEKFGYALDPEIKLAAQIRPYAISLIRRKYTAKNILGDLFDVFKNYIHLLRTLPTEISEILNTIKQGKLKHEISINDNGMLGEFLPSVAQRFLLAILLVGALIGSGLTMGQRPDWKPAEWSFTIAAILTGLFAFKMIFSSKKIR